MKFHANDMPPMPSRRLGVLLSILALSIASACASSGPDVTTLGFLDDYSRLSAGRPGQASLIYIDGTVDFSMYSAILIEPVVAWAAAGSEASPLTRELATNLDENLRRELAREFDLVDRPREGTLRMRAALAASNESHVVLEVEILDGVSGQRIVAAVDEREGPTAARANQTDAWAVLIRIRLSSFRQFDAAARARAAGESAP